MTDHNHSFGDFSLFGFSRGSKDALLEKLERRLGITPRTIDFGTAGFLHFYSSYGDIAETDDQIGLKLGFVRTPDVTPLSTQDLLVQKLISPQDVSPQKMRGSALIASFSKQVPEFSVFKTLLATPQLFYTQSEEGILCSSSQRHLLTALDHIEVNEEVVPYHFLFQTIPGTLTLIRNVHRLFPGQYLHWKEGDLRVEYIKDFRFSDIQQQYERVDSNTIDFAYERIKEILNAYLTDVEQREQGFGNLLSGGVDSAIFQVVLNERMAASRPLKSYSYAVKVPGFEMEENYARQASQLLGTDHTMMDIWPENYPDIVVKAIETAAQPIPSEANACKWAIANFLGSQDDTPRYFLVGQGADAVYGMGIVRKLTLLDVSQNIPGSQLALNSLSKIAQLHSDKIAHGLAELARAVSAKDQRASYDYWPNVFSLYIPIEKAINFFGEPSVQGMLAYRRSLEEQFLDSDNLFEKLHIVDLLTEGYEPAMFGSQMFLSQKREQIYPYLDEDIIRLSFAFKPNVRYVKPGFGFLDDNNVKYILKQILVQRSYEAIAHKTKGRSVFGSDLMNMMKNGPLQEMTQTIERPGFLSQTEFDKLLDKPNLTLWNLLTFDTFQKRVVQAHPKQ